MSSINHNEKKAVDAQGKNGSLSSLLFSVKSEIQEDALQYLKPVKGAQLAF